MSDSKAPLGDGQRLLEALGGANIFQQRVETTHKGLPPGSPYGEQGTGSVSLQGLGSHGLILHKQGKPFSRRPEYAHPVPPQMLPGNMPHYKQPTDHQRNQRARNPAPDRLSQLRDCRP